MLDFIIDFLLMFIVVIISIVLHELAHGFVALLNGDKTAKESGRLTLNPLINVVFVSVRICKTRAGKSQQFQKPQDGNDNCVACRYSIEFAAGIYLLSVCFAALSVPIYIYVFCLHGGNKSKFSHF